MTSKLTILVVEDEALIAENLRLTLEDLGYAVLDVCYTYAEALAAFAQHRPDLVLLDLNLGSTNPAHTGLALAAALNAQPQGPPFIFLTAYSDPDTVRRASRLHPGGYLVKPVNGAALFAAIQTAIGRATDAADEPLGDPDFHLGPAPTGVPTGLPAFFFVKHGLLTTRVFWTEVASIESSKNYVTLRVPALRLAHAIRGSLAFVLDQLMPEAQRARFQRVNRSTSLNTAFIESYEGLFVQCAGERYENSTGALPS